ncbi:IclR family transcriptional regulator [Ramlibacter humi]|uniref:IclR family transcriptional regulator n=1 Tax=Ramlibacter humi TaxID=2530451 RepID=A0A4Z0CAJ2_9BURK|nr:IclR family transcriptional regulator [Ramlibacter humi]TFZ08034.1 IclR family transcriptional regulator [Ramlibacter humi]
MTSDATAPGLRLLELLETLAQQTRAFSLADAVAATGWAKPTVHRMLGQLEAGGWLARQPDGRRYSLTARTLGLAEAALSTSSQLGVRHAVLRQLAADIGESCNLTALSGAEVVYLDRVESAFPLRIELRPGTRVPLHCSASGKLFLAHLPARRRQLLLDGVALERHTPQTITTRQALDEELERIRGCGHAVDAEEYVQGLVCVAVPVLAPGQNAVRCAVAVQAPAARMPLARALQHLGRLSDAARALGRTLGSE